MRKKRKCNQIDKGCQLPYSLPLSPPSRLPYSLASLRQKCQLISHVAQDENVAQVAHTQRVTARRWQRPTIACSTFASSRVESLSSGSNKTQFGHKNSRTSNRINARAKRSGRLAGTECAEQPYRPLGLGAAASSSGMANCEFCILPVASAVQLFCLLCQG